MLTASTNAQVESVRLLIIADSSAEAARISDLLRKAGDPLSFEVVNTAAGLREKIAGEAFDAVVCRQPLHDWESPTPLQILQAEGKLLPVILVTNGPSTGETTCLAAEGPAPRILNTSLESLPWALCRLLHEKAQREEQARRLEQANAASRHWNLTFDTVSESVMVLDTDHRIQRANRATAVLLGVDIKQIQGKKCFEIVHGSSAPPPQCPLQRMWRSGKAEREDIDEPRVGSTFDVIANPLLDAKGVPIGCVHVVRDISERARVERALRQSEETYRAFFQQNLAGNYISTAGGRLLDCNSAFLEIFGFVSVAEAKGVDLATLYPDPSARQRFLKKLEEDGHVEHYEKDLRRKDGRPLIVVENALGVFDSKGMLTEIRGFLLDETERRRAETQLRQAQKMDALGRLAGGVAHDFNNLLTIIIGYSEILLQHPALGEPAKPQVEQVLEAGRHAGRLTRQLLAFSRKQILQPVVMDLNHAVSELETMLGRLLPENIELRTRLYPVLAWVRADPGQIEQVLLNLVINARDAMPDGGKLVIETSHVQIEEGSTPEHALLGPGPYVRLTVSDTGIGMDKATQARIFEPFFTTKGPEKGTGLGLATVYGIVKQSGGHVSVESEVGTGSTFTVYLPAAKPVAEPEKPQVVSARPHGGVETILLVEDAPAIRSLTGVLLRREGYIVLEAGNLVEALRVAANYAGPIHLLLTDVVMPQGEGTALAERLAAARSGLKVLYITGHAENASLIRSLESGALILSKPFSQEELSRSVRRALDSPKGYTPAGG